MSFEVGRGAPPVSATRTVSRYPGVPVRQAPIVRNTEQYEREIVPMMADQRVGLLVWSPLAGGLLSGKFDAKAKPADARRCRFRKLHPPQWRLDNLDQDCSPFLAALARSSSTKTRRFSE